ncbi:hypothetical protein [Xanthomonas sacchari]|uniref:hypothetical protein n=1 Tax=Xanthomonas sacchari TaxID=56458 RepID=UPI000581BF28|nr:hypothetical protein [Xanthomonas sacchari]AJC46685.1 hypothetical protein SB85_13970 [Xanthomonas sacchari]
MNIIPDDRLPDAQPLVMALVADALAQSLAPASLQGVAVSAITADTPHAILEIALQDLADGHGLDKAVRTGMRYLLRRGKNQVAVAAAVDVGFNQAGTAPNRTKSLSAGDGMTPLGEALARAVAYAPPGATANADAELSLLRCRGVNVQALVLVPESGGEATVFPFVGMQASKSGHYTEKAFFDALRPQALRARRVFDQTPLGRESPAG